MIEGTFSSSCRCYCSWRSTMWRIQFLVIAMTMSVLCSAVTGTVMQGQPSNCPLSVWALTSVSLSVWAVIADYLCHCQCEQWLLTICVNVSVSRLLTVCVSRLMTVSVTVSVSRLLAVSLSVWADCRLSVSLSVWADCWLSVSLSVWADCWLSVWTDCWLLAWAMIADCQWDCQCEQTAGF